MKFSSTSLAVVSLCLHTGVTFGYLGAAPQTKSPPNFSLKTKGESNSMLVRDACRILSFSPTKKQYGSNFIVELDKKEIKKAYLLAAKVRTKTSKKIFIVEMQQRADSIFTVRSIILIMF